MAGDLDGPDCAMSFALASREAPRETPPPREPEPEPIKMHMDDAMNILRSIGGGHGAPAPAGDGDGAPPPRRPGPTNKGGAAAYRRPGY
jgi:hypothetical protein